MPCMSFVRLKLKYSVLKFPSFLFFGSSLSQMYEGENDRKILLKEKTPPHFLPTKTKTFLFAHSEGRKLFM